MVLNQTLPAEPGYFERSPVAGKSTAVEITDIRADRCNLSILIAFNKAYLGQIRGCRVATNLRHEWLPIRTAQRSQIEVALPPAAVTV